METRVLDARTDPEGAVREAAAILRRGGLVAFPTETVYGLGALGLDPAAVERIFLVKGRPPTDPLILHVAGAERVRELVRELPPEALRLMERFWPGPLTLVLPKSERVPPRVTAGLDSVAVRMPAHPLALALLREVGAPLAAPSANLFGRTSPTDARHVLEDLGGRIDAVLDGGPTPLGVESTVVDLRGPEPVILRPGGISREALEAALGRPVRVRPSASPLPEGEPEAAPAPSPGLLSRHYSPRAEVWLFDGEAAAVAEAVRRLLAAGSVRSPVGVLAYDEDAPLFETLPVRIYPLGPRSRPEEVARRLYATLRQADRDGMATLVLRLAPPGGLGDTLNDRITRAAAGRVFHV